MGYFTNGIRRIASVGGGISGGCLSGAVLLTVANVISRLIGAVIIGSYEIIQFTVSVMVAFALGYTALRKFHIVVRIVLERLSQQTQAIFESCISFVGIVMLVIMAWAGTGVVLERWRTEVTESLFLPYAPFRIIWVLGLILFCLVLVTDLFSALSRVVKK